MRRILWSIAAAVVFASGGPAHGATVDAAASDLAGAELLDLSVPGVVAFEVIAQDADPLEIAIDLEPAEIADPVLLAASIVAGNGLGLGGLRVRTLGNGVALGTIGTFARDAGSSVAAPPAQAGQVTLPLDIARTTHGIAIGDAIGPGTPWTIAAGGLAAPHGFRLRIEFIPEPDATLAGVAGLAALLALARPRRGRALLCAMGAALLGAGAASATQRVVTSATDGAAGSLRQILGSVAQDGDVISFGVPVVSLASELAIGVSVTLQGPGSIAPTGARAALTIAANDVTIQGVTFQNVGVSTPGGFGTTGLRVLGSTFQGDSALRLEHDASCEIANNAFDVATSGAEAVASAFLDGCTIAHNTFTASASAAFSDEQSEGLVLDHNGGDVRLVAYSKSGAITNNEVREIWVFPASVPAAAPLVVQGNTVARLHVQRANVEIANNTVNGGGADLGRLGIAAKLIHGGPGVPGGIHSAHHNTVTGGRIGILFADLIGPTFASEVRQNPVSDASQLGITARLSAGTAIDGNTVSGVGAGTGGTGIEILHARTPGVASGNTVTDTQGTGIEVIEPLATYTLDGNTATGSSAAGIEMRGGPGRLVATGNTATVGDGPGVAIRDGALATISGGIYADNGDAGILVFPGARAEITQISATRNAGPGIDLFPRAVTPNPATKTANQDLDWPEFVWDPATHRIVGVAAPDSRVEVYAVEGGPRIGNPANGEGVAYLGFAMTDSAGRFSYPSDGAFACVPQDRVTLTDTVPTANPYSSEFSPDFACDADGDGVAIGDDRCAATPEALAEQVDANGCSETRPRTDGGAVYCNTETSCAAVGQGGVGPCTDCAVETGSGAYWDCPGAASCGTSLDGSQDCFGCDITDGALSLDCDGAQCSYSTAGTYRCDGGPGECDVVRGDLATSCPLDLPCRKVIMGGANDSATRLEVRKQTLEGDATFTFRFSSESEAISTALGSGTSVIGLVAPPDSLHVEEVAQPGWELDSIECDVPLLVIGPGHVLPLVSDGGRARCTFVNTRTSSGPVRPIAISAPDVITRTNTFGLPPGNRIAVAGANGLVILDPLTGAIPAVGNTDLSFVGDVTYQGLLGALVVPKPSDPVADVIFGYRAAGGASFRGYVPAIGDFGSTLLVGGSVLDAVHLGNDPAQTEAVTAGGGSVQKVGWTDFGGGQLFPNLTTFVHSTAFNGIGQAPVSAFAFPAKTRVLAVTGGSPGKLAITDPANPFGTVAVGDVGDQPRRVRCLGSVCAVSNYGSDTLTIATWDGAESAAITATQAVGDGPIGIDLRQQGANVLVASTGFNDSTYAITEVAPDGSVVSSLSLPAPAGCEQPGHALWLGDPGETLVLSCFGSDALAVLTPGLPPP